MNQRQTLKLIVQASDSCVELLKYIDKNISAINRLGVRIHIEKVSHNEMNEDMSETLRKRGVTRLPALLDPSGKILIGLKKITELFEKNLGRADFQNRIGPVDNAEMGLNPDMSDYYMRELYNGKDRKGKMVARTDPDDVQDESADIERRMSEYRRNVPKHRREDMHHERDIDISPRQRVVYDDNIDNSSDDDYSPEPQRRKSSRPIKLSSSGDAHGDDMDNRMLEAFLNNNHQEL